MSGSGGEAVAPVGAAADEVVLASPELSVGVRPAQGMTITRVEPRPEAPNLLWIRPDHGDGERAEDPGPSGAASIDTLHDLFSGGWFEMSPHAGLPGRLDGRETMLHGLALRLPWTVTGRGETLMEAQLAPPGGLAFTRRVEIEGSGVRVTSAVENRGLRPEPVTHGEHPCFDRALFGGGSLDLAPRTARVLRPLDPANAMLAEGEFEWPHAPAAAGGTVDMSVVPVHVEGVQDHVTIELERPEVTLRSPFGLRATLHLDLASHPHLLLWRNLGSPGPPGHGTWDVLALEAMSGPGASVEEALRAGAVQRLMPGERVERSFALSVTQDRTLV
jgi:galactose mutarotase-like enzyme